MIRKLINEVLEREGGYVDHPADRGGPTNYGITLRTLESWSGHKVTADDVKNLDRKNAIIIYEDEYYLKPRISTLSEDLQPFIFDSAVNHGPSRAIRFLQSAINKLGPDQILVTDGLIGPMTIMKTNQALDFFGPDKIINEIVEQRNTFYRLIVKNDPSQKVFLNGWLARSNGFLWS